MDEVVGLVRVLEVVGKTACGRAKVNLLGQRHTWRVC